MWPTQLFDPNLSLNAEAVRSIILLLPVIGVGVAFWINPPSYQARVAMLLGVLWNVPYLLLLNMLAVRLGWWHFAPSPNAFYGMPVELLLGWAVLWGVLLPYACAHLHFTIPLLLALFIDLLAMPSIPMVVTLGEWWLVGEVLLLLGCLLPALLIYHLTVTRQAVYGRALLQSVIWGGWNLFLIPAIILAYEGKDIFALLTVDGWRFTLFANVFFAASLIGYAALYELTKAGEGTPLPFDPPHYLVTTGPYGYVANPLQIAMLLIFLSIALALQSRYMVLALVAVVVFSEAFVRWHHDADIKERFGDAWLHYKQGVRNWLPRWRPYTAGDFADSATAINATVYFSPVCAICRQTETGLRKLRPVGITFAPATLHPSRDLERVTYRHASGRFEEAGILAVARIYEQTNLSFALVAWLMRFPGVHQLLQIIVDGSSEQGGKVMRERADQ